MNLSQRFKLSLCQFLTLFDHAALARIDHRFGNEGDFGRPERFSESFAIDPVHGRVMRGWGGS